MFKNNNVQTLSGLNLLFFLSCSFNYMCWKVFQSISYWRCNEIISLESDILHCHSKITIDRTSICIKKEKNRICETSRTKHSLFNDFMLFLVWGFQVTKTAQNFEFSRIEISLSFEKFQVIPELKNLLDEIIPSSSLTLDRYLLTKCLIIQLFFPLTLFSIYLPFRNS